MCFRVVWLFVWLCVCCACGVVCVWKNKRCVSSKRPRVNVQKRTRVVLNVHTECGDLGHPFILTVVSLDRTCNLPTFVLDQWKHHVLGEEFSNSKENQTMGNPEQEICIAVQVTFDFSNSELRGGSKSRD